MNIKPFLLIVLFIISFFGSSGQDIDDIAQKMSFPSNLPIPRFILPLSDTLNGVSLRFEDLGSITPQKLNTVKNIEYVELCFSSQNDLDSLIGLLSNFKQLKYVRFSDNAWAKKISQEPIVMPNEILKYDIQAISFSGNWQMDYVKSLAVLHQLPNLSYFFFENIKQEIPFQLSSFKHLKGLSLHVTTDLNFPDWIVSFTKLESISIGYARFKIGGDNYLNYADILRNLSRLKELKGLYIRYMYNFKEKYDDVQLKKLEKLKISSSSIANSTEFFRFISNHKKLKSLELNGIYIDTIRSQILQLAHLEKLTIQGVNKPLITEFNFKSLKKLKLLKLSNYSTLQGNLEFPPGIVSLNLEGNNSTTFPNVSNLHKLVSLDLSYNLITALPNQLKGLRKLSSMNLANNKINELPQDIGSLSQLRDLNLMANPLKALPVSFGKLENLNHLDLSYCDLTRFPENFGNLKGLETLKVPGNFISTIQNSFTQLSNLKHVNFESNALTSIPDDFGALLNLTYLNLSNNDITTLPASIGKLHQLEQLTLNSNQLNMLPEELGQLTALRHISLSNHIGTQRSYDPRDIYRKGDPKPSRIKTSNTFANLPIDLSNWTKLRTLGMSNYTTLNEANLFKSLFTISAKGFSLELENVNITTLPLTGWDGFMVRVLNLRNNKLTSIPADIVNAPYLESYNFNNNRLPSKPINLNSFAGNKFEKLLWFREFGFIGDNALPKVDSMVFALVEKSNNHYYRKEFKQSVFYANQAIFINKDLALTKFFKTNLGEAYYEVGDYKQAIEVLSQAIKRDTVGPIRIMNSISPDFEFRAKSYLKLGDTLSAIKDYEHLAKDFSQNVWADIALLYRMTGDSNSAKIAFENGIKSYEQAIAFSKERKQDVALQQLSLLELYIVSEKFLLAQAYADTLKNEIKGLPNLTLLAYLSACAKIGANNSKEINFLTLEKEILASKKSIKSWGYQLFLKWLSITKIEKSKEMMMRNLTDLIK